MSTAIVPYVERPASREEQLEHIYAEVASGRSLKRVLEEDEGLPSKRTFWRWHMADENIRHNLARARENGVEALVDEAIHIADTPLEGVERTVERGPDGVKMRETRKEMLGHRRLQVETRIKYAQMIAPRKYSPRLDVTSDGEGLASIADAVTEGNKRLAERTKNK